MEREKETIKEKIERWKILADSLFKSNSKCYAKDVYDTYYFADIILVGDETIEIECFAPQGKKGKRFTLRWINILKFDEYKDKGEKNGKN